MIIKETKLEPGTGERFSYEENEHRKSKRNKYY